MSSRFGGQMNQTWLATIFGFCRAIYTVFTTPKIEGHDTSLYVQVAQNLKSVSIELQPEKKVLYQSIVNLSPEQKTTPETRLLSNREIMGVLGILMQFNSYIPHLRPYSYVDFHDTEKLYCAITKKGSLKPLDFADQLKIALTQTNGDLTEALWLLFITSRLYARWFDQSVIVDLPDFSRTEILRRMEMFARSVAACKPYSANSDQDSAGDNYYCWTHVLGKVIFSRHKFSTALLSFFAERAVHNGTRLNHGLAHRYKAQTLPSDHTRAAEYGNAIGKLLNENFLT